jgi:flagellar basal body-associated protein FliL
MAEHQVVERSESGVGMGVMLGIVVVLLVAVIALFFAFGGPTRFMGSAPSQTNVNVPAQQAPAAQQQPQSAPNVQVPRQIDVNVNQPPAQQPPAQPPAQQAPAQPPAQQAPAQPPAQQAPSGGS